jgi:hypothetical protein
MPNYELKTLEKLLLDYWYSIPNDSNNPAGEPVRLKIVAVRNDVITYHKINAKGQMFGIGSTSVENIEKNSYFIKSRLDLEHIMDVKGDLKK